MVSDDILTRVLAFTLFYLIVAVFGVLVLAISGMGFLESIGGAVTCLGDAVTDDHLYVNRVANIPCIDIIQYNPYGATGFGDYWHTVDDTMKNIDKNTLYVVGQTLLQVIYNL